MSDEKDTRKIIEPKDETKNLIKEFRALDEQFKAATADFEERHATEIEVLEKMRIERNGKLDEACRSLRAEAAKADITTIKGIKYGDDFLILKKWSSYYAPELFVAITQDKGLYETAIQEGVISVKTEVDYDKAKAWLTKNDLVTDYDRAEGGKELTPMLSVAPKEMAGLGQKIQDKKTKKGG